MLLASGAGHLRCSCLLARNRSKRPHPPKKHHTDTAQAPPTTSASSGERRSGGRSLRSGDGRGHQTSADWAVVLLIPTVVVLEQSGRGVGRRQAQRDAAKAARRTALSSVQPVLMTVGAAAG